MQIQILRNFLAHQSSEWKIASLYIWEALDLVYMIVLWGDTDLNLNNQKTRVWCCFRCGEKNLARGSSCLPE